MTTPAGKRHYLLIYRRQLEQYRWPALLAALAFGMLWWFSPPAIVSNDPNFSLFMQAVLLIAALAGVALLAYATWGPKQAYVQCQPTHLRVSTPLLRFNISYSRIRTCRPLKFAPAQLTSAQRHLVEPFLGRTAVVIDLNSYPLNEKWLRLWLNRFMFPSDSRGLVFVTDDWMALSRDIDTHRAQWKTRSER